MEKVLAERLQRQLLAKKHFQSPEETVRWMLAVQGQDYHPALWAIAMRTPGVTKKDLEQAVADMKIVRSWTMRHTIHFVAIEDLTWMMELSRDRMLKRYKNHMLKETGLDTKDLEQALLIIEAALKGKKLIPRPKLRKILEEANVDTKGQRYYHILWYAAQKGIIFIGPMAGKQQTLGLVSEWAPPSPFTTREAALKELASRYLASHGPATPKDLAWWAGLSVGEAKKAMEMATVTVDPVMEAFEPSLHLLPTLDEFLIGYQDRTASLTEAMRIQLDPLKRGIYRPLLFNGKVVGSWKPIVKGEKVTLSYSIHPNVQIPQTLLIKQAKAYATFFGHHFEGVEQVSEFQMRR